MAEASNGGCVSFAVTSSPSTRSAAASRPTLSEPSGVTPSRMRASASSTGSSAILGALLRVFARAPARLGGDADALKAHVAIDRLQHVIERQAGDRHGGQRFHLDARLA